MAFRVWGFGGGGGGVWGSWGVLGGWGLSCSVDTAPKNMRLDLGVPHHEDLNATCNHRVPEPRKTFRANCSLQPLTSTHTLNPKPSP